MSASLSALTTATSHGRAGRGIDAGEMAEPFWELMDEIHLAFQDALVRVGPGSCGQVV